MEALFKSKVLEFQFDYDEWPAQNSDTRKCIAPYNQSFFKIRYLYGTTFSKHFKADCKKEAAKLDGNPKTGFEKVFKIKYKHYKNNYQNKECLYTVWNKTDLDSKMKYSLPDFFWLFTTI